MGTFPLVVCLVVVGCYCLTAVDVGGGREMMMEETKTSDVEKRSEQMGRRKEVNEIYNF